MILTAAWTQQERDTLIQSHFICDVHVTVEALSAAYIDYCHCLFTLRLSPFAVCPFASCTLLSFVMELLKNSVAMQEQVLACKGFLVIGHTLEKVRQTASSLRNSFTSWIWLDWVLACHHCVSFSSTLSTLPCVLASYERSCYLSSYIFFLWLCLSLSPPRFMWRGLSWTLYWPFPDTSATYRTASCCSNSSATTSCSTPPFGSTRLPRSL